MKKEIEDKIKNLGYELHFTNGNRTILNFSKFFNKRCQYAENLDDAYFSIGLEVKDNDEFEFIFITTAPMYRFSSGIFSNVLREDFEDIEYKFALYCSYLVKCYILNIQ